jgi:hypothetical protein
MPVGGRHREAPSTDQREALRRPALAAPRGRGAARGQGVPPGRTARERLTAVAAGNAIGPRRVDEALAITGIAKAADRRAGNFSLGRSQRLGIAAGLLGDPGVLQGWRAGQPG